MNIGNITRASLAAAAALAVSAACTKQQTQTTYDSQDKKIDSFIQSQLSGSKALRVQVNGGSSRLVIAEGTGEDSLSTSGTVSFFYAAYTFSGSLSQNNLFATNRQETAEAAGWTGLTDADYAASTVTLSDSGSLMEGLRLGLEGVKEGQECYILFSGRYGFGSRPVGTIPANSALLYHIWVDSIENNR